jgi:hypothetical protein
MPIVLVIGLITVGFMVMIITWGNLIKALATRKYSAKPHAIIAPISTVLTTAFVIWSIVASSIPYELKTETAKVRTLEQDDGVTFQVVVFSDGKLENITEKLNYIVPDGSIIMKTSLVHDWAGGICWMSSKSPTYEVVK